MKKISKTMLATAAVAAGALLAGGVTFAATGPSGMQHPGFGDRGPAMHGQVPGVFGTVTAVNGTTLTVQGMGPGQFSGKWNDQDNDDATSTKVQPTSTVVYTVDAANATVMKNGTSSTVGAISVNDKIMVAGTVNGASVTATSIVDGVGPGGGMFRGQAKGGALANLQGNGEPVVGGTVTAVNGAMFTVTNKSNVTYSIDAANATVVKGNATSSVSAVAVNDNVIVQGTVNGTSVTASSVIDQGAAPSSAGSGNGTSTPAKGFMGGFGGFFGGIGSFFHHLFGFF